jgi:hypothetical protein
VSVGLGWRLVAAVWKILGRPVGRHLKEGSALARLPSYLFDHRFGDFLFPECPLRGHC